MVLLLLCPEQGKITLFEHEDFVGAKRTSRRSNPNIGSIVIDKSTSVKVTPGEIWVLYADRNYRGDTLTVTKDIPNVGRHLNDRLTSLRKI